MEGGWKFFPPDQGDGVHCLCLCPPEHNRAHLDMGGFAYTAPSPLFFEGIREKWLDAREYPESMNASWNFIPRWIDNRGGGKGLCNRKFVDHILGKKDFPRSFLGGLV